MPLVVETPGISYHDDIKPILSVDLHPSGRMATGGADHMVRIWQVAARPNQEPANATPPPDTTDDAAMTTPATATTPQQSHRTELTFLANLAVHEQPVNAVKFSPDGKYLASASDDNWIVIWQRVEEQTETTPTNANAPAANTHAQTDAAAHSLSIDLTDSAPPAAAAVAGQELASPSPAVAAAAASLPFGVDPEDVIESKEKWVQLQRMRGHVSEIYDLCWSPNSKELLTGSIDHHTLVWSLEKGAFTQTLKDHSGYVQGVCWDPLNQYLATQSSDRSVKVYERKRNLKTKSTKPQIEFVEKWTIKNRKTLRVGGGSGALAAPGAAVTNGSAAKEEATGAGVTPKKSKLQPLALNLDSPMNGGGSDLDQQENRPPIHINLVDNLPPLGLTGDLAIALGATGGSGQSPTKKEKAVSTHITRPMYMDDAHTSYYRRLTFSPDGQFLVTPAGQFHADELAGPSGPGQQQEEEEFSLLGKIKSPVQAGDESTGTAETKAGGSSFPTCYLFHRSDFSRPVCHLPQLDPTVVVKFNPKLFQRRCTPTTTNSKVGEDGDASAAAEKMSTLPYRMVFALATTKQLLLYDTESAYPLALIKNMHHAGVTDLAWSQDGLTLVASSSDGYCSYIYLTASHPEVGPLLPEAEQQAYQAWWQVRREQIAQAILTEGETTGKSKKSLGGGGVGGGEKDQVKEARTAIVDLLGAEPAPLPSWTPPTASDATAASGALAGGHGGSAEKSSTTGTPAVKRNRPDSELFTHAIQLLQNGHALTATKLHTDSGTGMARVKKILEFVDALTLRTLGQVFAQATMESACTTRPMDFGECLSFELAATSESELAKAKGTKWDATKVEYAMKDIQVKEKKPKANKVLQLPAELDALVIAAPTTTAAAAVPTTAAPTAAATATGAAATGTAAQPMVIDEPSVTIAETTAPPPSAAAATAVPTSVAAVAPASPAKVASETPAAVVAPSPSSSSPASPSLATPLQKPTSSTPSSQSSSNQKKRKSPPGGESHPVAGGAPGDANSGKPKTTIMDMFRKASASKPSASASASSSAAAAAGVHPKPAGVTVSKSDAVDLTTPSVHLDEVPLAQPRAKRRITPEKVEEHAPVTKADVPPVTQTPVVAKAAVAATPSATVAAAAAVGVVSMDVSSDSDGESVSYVVEKILKKRTTSGGSVEYYIKWLGYDSSHNTWQKEDDMECDDLMAAFERAQKPKKKITPTHVTAATTTTTTTTAAPAAAAAAAAAVVVSPKKSLPVGPGASIASLSPKKRKATEDAPAAPVTAPAASSSSASPASAPATSSSADAVHVPEVKKAKRKIVPQAAD